MPGAWPCGPGVLTPANPSAPPALFPPVRHPNGLFLTKLAHTQGRGRGRLIAFRRRTILSGTHVPGRLIDETFSTDWLHVDRAACGDCYHRRAGGDPVPGL